MTNPLYLSDWQVRISKFDDFADPMVNVYVFRRDTENNKTQCLVIESPTQFTIKDQEPGSILPTTFEMPLELLKSMTVGLVNEAQRLNIPVPDQKGLLEEVRKDKAWLQAAIDKLIG